MKKSDIKVVFMGTPDFAKESFKKLVEEKFNVVACFTNEDKPSGRGMKLKASAVKEYAIEQNIPVYQPKSVRNNEEIINILKGYEPDFIAVVAYGKILPKEILDIPKYGCINVHGSLLPKYRGAAPMQWAIINGEEKTGITTMLMDVGMDTGDMLLKEEVEIKKSDNLETIHDKLMKIGANLLCETLEKMVEGCITPVKQSDEFTIAPMITREMTKIDFNKKARDIFNFVRGLSPFPGTYMVLDDERKFKVFDVEYSNEICDDEIENGTVILATKDKLHIKCSDGYVSINQIQPTNSKRMDVKAFFAGNKIECGQKMV